MKTRLATTLAAAVLAFAGANLAHAAQVSGAVGATGQGDMTYRIGLSWDWDKQWLQSSTGHLTGYWDAAYTYWEGGEASGAHSLSFSPVFVYEFSGFTYTPTSRRALAWQRSPRLTLATNAWALRSTSKTASALA